MKITPFLARYTVTPHAYPAERLPILSHMQQKCMGLPDAYSAEGLPLLMHMRQKSLCRPDAHSAEVGLEVLLLL